MSEPPSLATAAVAGPADGLVRPATDPRSRRRSEDLRFVTGTGRYVGNATLAGELAMAVVRSPHAHADIVALDIAAAAEMPGVVGVYTVDDLAAEGVGPLPWALDIKGDGPVVVPARPALARSRVRYVGEPVAFVVAEDRVAAEEAAEAVLVEYRERDAAIDTALAAAPGAPDIWPDAPGNEAFRFRRGDAARTADAFGSASHVVELDLLNNRVAAVSLEPRMALAEWDGATGHYRLTVSAASVHDIRADLATVFAVAPEQVEVVAPDVGGGFGMKNVLYPEFVLGLWAARRHGRPVRWSGSRMEDFLAGAHGRSNVTTARLALDEDGRFLALDVRTLADLGAFISPHGPTAATLAPATALGGIYDIPAVAFEVRGVFTNTSPIDAYRGAGKPEVNYIVERLIDVAADRLGLDPVALRHRNFIARFPHRTAMGLTIDGGEFAADLDRVLALADRGGFPARREAAARRGKLRGMGVACFLETARGRPGEEAWLRFREDGLIDLGIGTQSNGQGHETSFVQLVAERLGLPTELFCFVQGDTTRIATGGGHGGARSLHQGGTALLLVVEDVLARARPLAAELLQADPAALAFRDGAFVLADAPRGSSVDLPALAKACRERGQADAIDGHAVHGCDVFTFPSGAHVAEVEIDPETGTVDLVSYVAVDDFGTLVNPLMAEGQVQGGIAQGVGQALCEGIRYDPESGQLLSATLMDYAIPRGEDLPDIRIRFVEVPTAANPIGSKGAGQAGAIAAPPTVVNAVIDALSGRGIDHLDMPLTPERVWAALRKSREAT